MSRIGYDAKIKCAKFVLQKHIALTHTILLRFRTQPLRGDLSHLESEYSSCLCRLQLPTNFNTRLFLVRHRLCFMFSTSTLVGCLSTSLENVFFMVHGWICSNCCDIAPAIPKYPSERDGYDALLKQDEDTMMQLDPSHTDLSATATNPRSSVTLAPVRQHIGDKSHQPSFTKQSFSKKRRASILAGRSSSTGPEIDGEQQLLVMRHGHRQDEEERSWHETAEHPWNPPLSVLGRQQVRTCSPMCCLCLLL